jgi:methylated-DNA-[protein]-cysteine S-methyltransferase
MDTPIGGLRLHANAGLITAIDFDARPKRTKAADPLLDEAQRQLTEYFAGERTTFDLPLASDGTEFQNKVWGELRRIPFGETASYGDVARRLGYEPVISRAVGAANGANPIPILVPCHRVIGANGTLTGYAGGIERKRTLLALEQPGLF